MKLYPLYTGLLVVGLSSHIVAQTNENISTTLSSVDRIKQTMLSYEKSHTAISTDTLPQINGTNTLRNSTGQVLKTGFFQNSVLIDGEIYKYDTKGTLIEKHVYRGGRFITKLMQ